jgi:uncharacterized damage-inducible protein DinB
MLLLFGFIQQPKIQKKGISYNDMTYIEPSNKERSGIGLMGQLLRLARYETISMVQHLSQEALDFRSPFCDNSIGSLAMHICALERLHYSLIFNLPFPAEESALWSRFLQGNLIHVGKLNQPSEYFVEKLKEQHTKTLDNLKTKNEAWLYADVKKDNYHFNNAYLLFHRMEDEIRHQGQIKLILKAFKNATK